MLLGSLRNLRAGDFEVVLPWPTGLETSGEFEDAAIIIRRPPGTDLMGEINVDSGHPGVGNGRGFWGPLGWRP